MKENNLKLVTTKNFGDLPCEFYCDNNNEILLTREQIGTALRYKTPDDAIYRIHKRHKERLDEFSVLTKLASTDGKSYETTLYTQRGVMEICRWSNKPKANQFMDWIQVISEKYANYNNDTTSEDNSTDLSVNFEMDNSQEESYKSGSVQYMESREVAEIVGKEHNKLLRDIRTYVNQLIETKIGHVNFFIESTYMDAKGENRPCYLITKKGCEFIAHKITGIKGTKFTAIYINRFHDMENIIQNNSSYDIPSLIQSIDNLTKTMNTAITSLDERLRILEENAVQPQKIIQNKKYKSRWLKDTFEKLNLFLDYLKENKDILSDTLLPQSGKLDLSWTIHLVIKQAEDTNHSFDFDEYRERYEYETQINTYQTLTYIEYYSVTKKLFTETLDLILTSLGLNENRINNKSMLDELLSCVS